MTVHVGELHTDVSQSNGSGSAAASDQRPVADATTDTEDERWREARGRSEWLAHRTAAEGFDD